MGKNRPIIIFAILILAILLLNNVNVNAQFVQQGNKLVATDGTEPSFQGSSVSISADGNTAVVGGSGDQNDTGAVWIYTRQNGVWTQQGSKLVGTGYTGPASQGSSVSISADGNTIIAGGSSDNAGVGAAWIFIRQNGTWTQQGLKLVGSGSIGNANQGYKVGLSGDGNTAIIGGQGDNSEIGAAWIFVRQNGSWTEQQKLVGNDITGIAGFGKSVGLSFDGNTAIAGGDFDNTYTGAAWIFTRQNGTWTQQGPKLVGSDSQQGQSKQGYASAISADGNTAAVGAFDEFNYAGAVFIWTRQNGTWIQQGPKLSGTNPIGDSRLGISVSISSDGNTVVGGGYYDNTGIGAIWTFTRTDTVWSQLGTKIIPSGYAGTPYIGNEISLSADGLTFIVGGSSDNNNIGAAWVFVLQSLVSVTGTVTLNAHPLANVSVYLQDTLGNNLLANPVVTNSLGKYLINPSPFPISSGGYQIAIDDPYGYLVDLNPKPVPAGSVNPVINFALTQIVTGNKSKFRDYWEDAFNYFVNHKGHQTESSTNLSHDISVITQHYMTRFPTIFSGISLFPDWFNVLNRQHNSTALQSAKAELAALLFNYASQKVSQGFIVTKDNRTVGDVITYVSNLILTNSNLSLAASLARSVNYRNMIKANLIPPGNIQYKSNDYNSVSVNVPTEYKLFANYPNPFNPATSIRYSIPNDDHITLTIYDVNGKEVEKLADQDVHAGTYDIIWNADKIASGVYFFKLKTREFQKTNKMILLK